MEKITLKNLLTMYSFACMMATWAGVPLTYAKTEDVPVKQEQEKKEADMGGNPSLESEESMRNWVPSQEMGKLQEDINQLFRRMLQAAVPMNQGTFEVRTDIQELPDKYVYKADIPGMDKDKIDIAVADQSLKISGERKYEMQERKKGMYREERSFGSFERTLPLPRDVKADKITAKYDRGVLTIEIPKMTTTPAAEKGAKKISVQ